MVQVLQLHQHEACGVVLVGFCCTVLLPVRLDGRKKVVVFGYGEDQRLRRLRPVPHNSVSTEAWLPPTLAAPRTAHLAQHPGVGRMVS